MDVVRLFTNLLAVHRQQLQALAVQGEIQTEALAQLLEKEELRRMEPDVKLEEVKDPEAYLLLLEEADSNSRLSNVKWGLLGGECLRSGEPNYETLRASLQSQVRAEESRRQEDFSYLRYDPERGPRELGQGLESAAQHWLRPERRTAAEVVRCVALQRFVSLLPTHVGDCVLKQCPQDMEEAIYMAEEYLNNTPGDKCSEMDNHTDGEGYPAEQLREEEAGPTEHQVNSEKMKVTGPGLFLKRIEFSKVCQSNTFNIDARHLEDIYSEERRLDGEDDLVEEDNFSEHEDWIKEEIKYNNQAEVEDEIRSASEMGQSADVARNTENVERSQLRNIANQMPVFGRAKRGVSAPVISSSSPNTAETEGETPCCLKRKNKEDPFHRPSHCCHDCGKSYKRAAFLSKHSCSAFPKFICPDCAQVFASQKCLTHHRRSHNKALGCSECGKQFRDKYNLKCHMRTHTGESPYTCTDCGDVFAQLKGLQEHRNIHTEERPFRCSVCGEVFHHSHTLTKHKLLHSQESFLCTRCGKSFKLNDDLLRHLRTVHDESMYLNGDQSFHKNGDISPRPYWN
ncbi:zinc finger and SCAN domain-containing protein 21-like [Salvelinus alpinus]|uniref:zinc finger and SCAN domain-containing protein 21-like n=1 Tax=Salvelinus alpinus TaxID=8036 RepID=UPI0039FBC5C9